MIEKIEDLKSKNVGLFRDWYTKNFPLIDNTFDQMTVYRMLVEFTDKLNEVITNENDVTDDMKVLHDYVAHYFDNLDVQAEINNKLDEMAASGLLDDLYKKYVDPILNRIESKVDSVASGSPKGVFANESELKSVNPDHKYIYLVSSNGEWYYWDTELSDWNSGGVYQASIIEKNSVGLYNLDESLQNSLAPYITSNIEYEVLKGFYNSLGEFKSDNNINSIKINLKDINSLYVNTINAKSYYGEFLVNYVLIKNGIVIFKDSHKNQSSSNFKQIININNKESDYIVINVTTPFIYSILKIDSLKPNYKIGYDDLNESLKGGYTLEFNKNIDKTILVDKSIMGSSFYLVENQNSYKVIKCKVKPNTYYKIKKATTFYNKPTILFAGNDSTFTKEINNLTITYNNGIDSLSYGGSGEPVLLDDIIIKTPIDCTCIYINTPNNYFDSLQILEETGLSTALQDLTDYTLNPLNEKTICFIGDSITYGPGWRPDGEYGSTGWVKIIKDNNPKAKIYGYGVGGTTIAKRFNINTSILERLSNIKEDHPNSDLIVIQGGVNDAWLNIPIGSFSPDRFEDSLDEMSFCGALESCFKYCQENFEGKKVAFILSQKIYNNPNLYKYYEKAREICKKWSVPYIDLYNEGNLNFMLANIRLNYSQNNENPLGDGCHPNEKGYRIITPLIENEIKYKII